MAIDVAAFLPGRWLWGTPSDLPPPDAFAGKSILLASEGRPIPPAATKLAGRMAERAGAEVHVLSIARIWGSSFGLTHPGLLPNKREMQERYESVEAALSSLKRRHVVASGQVSGTRNAAKRILAEARRHGADAIVMAADPPLYWFLSNMVWSQEPYRVRRMAPVPVYLVIDDQEAVGRRDRGHQP
jgi:nucleotide-binding universal stress UspA family protein